MSQVVLLILGHSVLEWRVLFLNLTRWRCLLGFQVEISNRWFHTWREMISNSGIRWYVCDHLTPKFQTSISEWITQNFFVCVCGVPSLLFKKVFTLAALSLCYAHGVSCSAACDILVPWPGIQSASPDLEGRVLTTGPLGKSPPRTF